MKLWSFLRWFWRVVIRRRLIFSLVTVLVALSGMVWWWGWDWVATGWWCSWKWLRTGSGGLESGSTTVRNLGLVVGGGIAIWVAYWRSVIAQRAGLLNERCQKGAEMLGSEVLSVRLGGIYALQRLVQDQPRQYHVQVMRLFCAFVRNPTKEAAAATSGVPATGHPIVKIAREDVQAALSVIGDRSVGDMKLEKKEDLAPNLFGANLSGANMARANLAGVILAGADFSEANLAGADLTGVVLIGPRPSGVNFVRVTRERLAEARLTRTQIPDVILAKAKGLTQGQLDQACSDPDKPPNLKGLRDAENGLLLEWRGKPCRR